MRVLKEDRIVALFIAACAVAGCGGGAGSAPASGLEGPPRIERGAAPAYATADSAAAQELRQIFEETHAFLVLELEALERPGRIDARLAEARSIIETAEEFYLEGRMLIAIELLAEAEVLLKTNP